MEVMGAGMTAWRTLTGRREVSGNAAREVENAAMRSSSSISESGPLTRGRKAKAESGPRPCGGRIANLFGDPETGKVARDTTMADAEGKDRARVCDLCVWTS
jgi:hypothetical protein